MNAHEVVKDWAHKTLWIRPNHLLYAVTDFRLTDIAIFSMFTLSRRILFHVIISTKRKSVVSHQ